jgi:hypothetical protein
MSAYACYSSFQEMVCPDDMDIFPMSLKAIHDFTTILDRHFNAEKSIKIYTGHDMQAVTNAAFLVGPRGGSRPAAPPPPP